MRVLNFVSLFPSAKQKALLLKRKDVSAALRAAESGVVDQVMLTTDGEGQRFVKIRKEKEKNKKRLTFFLFTFE